jgi:hypothetical protein
MSKTRFLLRFLLCIAILLVVWSRSPLARLYSDAVVAIAARLGPPLHGWVLDQPPPPARPVWRQGDHRVEAALQFDALAVGVVPLLALILATPGIKPGRRLLRCLLGASGNLLISAAIVTAFPLLVFYKNVFTDILGTFLGLIAFVGAPAILWFVLCRDELPVRLPRLAGLSRQSRRDDDSLPAA